jgi:sporulation protein YlmC with PRC-barrel domain
LNLLRGRRRLFAGRDELLETDMAEILTKSADVQGKHLTGRDGVKLGTVREMFVDLASGQVEFLVVEAGGLLSGSGKFHPVPWSAVRYDSVAGAFQAQRTKDEFKASPSYDRDQLADTTYAWHEQATRFFATTPSDA